MYRIEAETAQDWWEVEALYDTCFAPGRELLSSYRLRDGVPMVEALCFLVRDADDVLAAAIRFWPVRIVDGSAETSAAKEAGPAALLLGPIAVHPTRQGEGLGAVLMQHAMDTARDSGWSRVLLVGDAPYYGRFGFTRLSEVSMPPPTNPDRVLGHALKPGAWDGVTGRVEKFHDAI